VPDFLSVSLSSTDYVGHLFGPSSLEAEDNMKRLDRTLADLLAHVDAAVGLDQTLIVLSADHGAPERRNISPPSGSRRRPSAFRTSTRNRASRACAATSVSPAS
jgi:predicted AlkP superfamily pyrophosphatase or phosphodiesterase